MPRDFRVHLEDILGAIGKIRRYTKGLSSNEKRQESMPRSPSIDPGADDERLRTFQQAFADHVQLPHRRLGDR
jgi:hypothetical protein